MTGEQDFCMRSLCPSKIFVLATYGFGEEESLLLFEMDLYSRNGQCCVQNTAIAWVHPLFRFLMAKLVTQMLTLQHLHVELRVRSFRLVSTGRLGGGEKPFSMFFEIS